MTDDATTHADRIEGVREELAVVKRRQYRTPEVERRQKRLERQLRRLERQRQASAWADSEKDLE